MKEFRPTRGLVPIRRSSGRSSDPRESHVGNPRVGARIRFGTRRTVGVATAAGGDTRSHQADQFTQASFIAYA